MSTKPMAYIDTDDALTIRASAIGKCSRALWAALNEVESVAPTEKLELIFAEGHMHEEAMRQMLVSEGAIMHPQEEVTLWIIPGQLKVVGHVDGNITNWKQVWEAKALGNQGYRRFQNVGFDAYPEYPWQISVYMIALDLPALYTIKNRDNGDITRFTIDSPPVSLSDITAKAIGIYKAYESHEMPLCDPERFLCSYYFLHDEQAEDEPMQTIEDPYIEAAAGALAEIREQQKYLKDKGNELRDDLMRLTPGKHLAGQYEIGIRKVVTNRLNKDKMIEAGLNPDDYKAPVESTRVEIKATKEKLVARREEDDVPNL